MPKNENKEFEVYNIRLHKGDYAAIGNLFPKLKAGPAIRAIVHNFIERNKASAAPLDIELPIDVLDEVME
jgi:hypothetical protein